MQDTPPSIPDFTQWPSFPFEGDLRVKQLDDPVPVEPPRKGEAHRECTACLAPDEAYIWVGERWRVRAMDRPTGLPMVLILESRSHLDLGDLPNLLAAELGVMTVRLERAIRSLDGVARVHVNRWGDGSAHLHMWFLARPYGRLQLRGTFLSLWDSILPPISEDKWRENLALVAAWLAEFGGRPLAEPPRIQWQAPSSLAAQSAAPTDETSSESGSLLDAIGETAAPPDAPGATVGAERSADSVADAAAEQSDAAPQGGTEADPDGARQEQTEQSAPNTTGPPAEIGGGAQAEIASPATAATGTAEITEPTESTGVADPAEAAEPTDGAESTDAAETSGAAGRADAETNGPKADMVEAQQPAPDADGPRPTN